MIYLEKNNLDELVSKGTHLVDFYAEWCGPCKMLMPELESIDDKINIIKVDIDKFEDITLQHKIMSVPTLMFFKDGEKKLEVVGYRTKENLEKIIKNL